ncbi:MAG: lipopolysaccharide kinase InaA family protein [PVC group bacterium]
MMYDLSKIKAALPEGFGCLTAGGRICIFQDRWENEIRRLDENGLPTGSERGHLRGRGHPAVLPVGPEKLVVRHYYHGGIFRRLTRDLFLNLRRPLNEISILAAARKAGISVPEPAGLLIETVPPVFCRADLVTVYVPGSQDLLAYYREFPFSPGFGDRREKRRIIAAAAREVSLLHRAGIVHGDLQVKNIMIRKTPADLRIFILDFDRARRTAIPGARVRKNLLRLYRSFRKMSLSLPRVSRYDPVRFLRAYAPEEKEFRRSTVGAVRRRRWRERLHLLKWKLSLRLGGGLYARPMSGIKKRMEHK